MSTCNATANSGNVSQIADSVTAVQEAMEFQRRYMAAPRRSWGRRKAKIILASVAAVNRPEWLDPTSIYRVTNPVRIQCRHCGQVFICSHNAPRYCSEECRQTRTKALQAARRQRIREKLAKIGAQYPSLGARFGVECEYCEKPFRGQRSNARYCSTRCRVAAHRKLFTEGAK